jgi:hypothetical protein
MILTLRNLTLDEAKMTCEIIETHGLFSIAKVKIKKSFSKQKVYVGATPIDEFKRHAGQPAYTVKKKLREVSEAYEVLLRKEKRNKKGETVKSWFMPIVRLNSLDEAHTTIENILSKQKEIQDKMEADLKKKEEDSNARSNEGDRPISEG